MRGAVGYMEPQPLLYARLAAQTAVGHQVGQSRGAGPGMGERLNRLARPARSCRRRPSGNCAAKRPRLRTWRLSPRRAYAGPTGQPGSARWRLPRPTCTRKPQNGCWLQAALGDKWLIYVHCRWEGGWCWLRGRCLAAMNLPWPEQSALDERAGLAVLNAARAGFRGSINGFNSRHDLSPLYFAWLLVALLLNVGG